MIDLVLLAMGPITSALDTASSDVSGLKTAILTILGVFATVGIAWGIVSLVKR